MLRDTHGHAGIDHPNADDSVPGLKPPSHRSLCFARQQQLCGPRPSNKSNRDGQRIGSRCRGQRHRRGVLCERPADLHEHDIELELVRAVGGHLPTDSHRLRHARANKPDRLEQRDHHQLGAMAGDKLDNLKQCGGSGRHQPGERRRHQYVGRHGHLHDLFHKQWRHSVQHRGGRQQPSHPGPVDCVGNNS